MQRSSLADIDIQKDARRPARSRLPFEATLRRLSKYVAGRLVLYAIAVVYG